MNGRSRATGPLVAVASLGMVAAILVTTDRAAASPDSGDSAFSNDSSSSNPSNQGVVPEEVRVETGRFEPGAPDWAYVPVDVPAGVREIAVRYTYDKPAPPPGAAGNALDIGIFDADGHDLDDAAGFRGWSGGARDSFTISRGSATPGYLPGPIRPGRWHVILGPYTVAPQGMNWRVEITLRFGDPGPAFVPRYSPSRVPGRGFGWYRGDLHLHTVHSDGKRLPAEVAAGARERKLDFFVSTEHNTTSANAVWGDVAGSDLLIVSGEEVTTRNGHLVAAGIGPNQWIDWRYRAEDAQLARFVGKIHRGGGLAIAAHPYCPFVGCDWKFGYADVDAIELWNGPWTGDDALAVALWDGMLRDYVQRKGPRRWMPAVGSSDAHREPQIIGLPQTVVQARSLSRQGILDGVGAGTSWLAESADVALEMSARAGIFEAGIGERLLAFPHTNIGVEVKVAGVPGTTVRLITDRGEVHAVPVPASGTASFTWRTVAREAAYVRAEVRRPVPTESTPDTLVALSNPIFLGWR
ncbi:CehA/McbA family metallohydrolase [Pendulispora albinea]|uniref:CehA/McbA family metallohydrolase n=1 Tax=Pendulispora albinea TaxID=2741071 RepID=A0ABZ2M4Q5_9BACT